MHPPISQARIQSPLCSTPYIYTSHTPQNYFFLYQYVFALLFDLEVQVHLKTPKRPTVQGITADADTGKGGSVLKRLEFQAYHRSAKINELI